MPAFLSKILQLLMPTFLNWLYGKFEDYQRKRQEVEEIKRRAKEEAEAAARQLREAKTKEELDKAAENVARKF